MRVAKFVFVILLGCVLAGSVIAQSGVFVQRAKPVDPKLIYGPQYDVFWPKLQDPASCFEREDIILQVSPAGCEPGVVRSDLLAEQNVPVFCQIDALKVNPLIDVKQIRNIRFAGVYPPGVIGTGFHPARAALRTSDQLLGDPLINNIGYVVVVLASNPVEDDLPDELEFTLNAQIEYDAGNAFGIGRVEFLLEEFGSEEEWLRNRNKNSFWQGRYFIRLEEAKEDYVIVSIYQGDRKVSTSRVERGRPSNDIFVPGLYCQAGLTVEFGGYESSPVTAVLSVNDDVIEVKEGDNFFNNKCRVSDINAKTGSQGELVVVCGDTSSKLEIGVREVQEGDEVIIKGEEEFWIVEEVIDESQYYVSNGQERKFVDIRDVDFVGEGRLFEKKYDEETERYFESAIKSYESVINDYPSERVDGVTTMTYSEQALLEAIDLSSSFGKQVTEARLINGFLERSPESELYDNLNVDLGELYKYDKTSAGTYFELDKSFASVTLEGFNDRGVSSAELNWGSERISISVEEELSFVDMGDLTLRRVGSDSEVDVTVRCADSEVDVERLNLLIGDREQIVCGKSLELISVNTKQLAKVRLLPQVGSIFSETNFSVGIGIEKRAIDLTPEKAKKRIVNIEKAIDRWAGISKSLNEVNKGLKSACFATAGILTVKNFLSGLGGEGFARQKVMRGFWNEECARLVDNGQYSTLNQCYLSEASTIDSDVRAVNNALDRVNDRLRKIQGKYSRPVEGIGGLFGESVVNSEASANEFVDEVLLGEEKYANYEINLGDEKGTITVRDLFSDANYATGDFSYDQVREVMLNVDLAGGGSGVSFGVGEAANENLVNIGSNIYENKVLSQRLEESKVNVVPGLPPMGPLLTGSQIQTSKVAHVGLSESVENQLSIEFNEKSTHVVQMPAPAAAGFASGVYVLGLSRPTPTSTNYLVNEVYVRDDNGNYISQDASEFQKVYGIASVEAAESVSYNNRYLNPEVRFFETEPYKGMPAVVPFDVNNGWYTATEQTLPVFGGIGSFDGSGMPRSFWVCNVGSDGREQFFENRARDICQLINLNTGQPLNQFPGLDESTARGVINKAVQALQEAARQYDEGRKGVMNILGASVPVGIPAAAIPGVQCQEFMSPGDCHLLFNVCDPVICPSSRCDLGGQYPVADVIQTGIIGSLALCAPNIREGIFLPVCLTGVQAGIDSYLSILESHKQCLQENIETGQTVGICDEITSIYTCEFFWRQAAPLADIVLPKIFEVTTGQTAARGGAEYLNVQNAWQSAQGSVKFFTQSYAVNSIEAFKLRASEGIGSQFCKAFVSVKGPKALESLIEPDSPPQYHAWFSATPFSDATLPATSQYKVFYHIFAGRDTGVPYTVYLRDPPISTYYNLPGTVQVAAGFVPKGGFATDTIDFTAPEGYKELCIRVAEREECGFKQVTTDFALNYLRDEFVSGELTRTDIVSQEQCISGSALSATSILNPNPQAAIEEAINPDIYNRGVVRICGSQNPGSGTDPERYVKVGICDDDSIGCWLDKVSVDASLSRNLDFDEGAKARTLNDLEAIEVENLRRAGEILEVDSISAIIDDVERQIGCCIKEEKARELIAVIDGTLEKTVLNYQKAHLVLLKGDIYAKVAKQKVSAIKENEAEEIIIKVEEELIIEEEVVDTVVGDIIVPPQDCSVSRVSATKKDVVKGEPFTIRVDLLGDCKKWGYVNIDLNKAGGNDLELGDFALVKEDRTKGYYVKSQIIQEGGVYIYTVRTKFKERGIERISGIDYNIDDPNVNVQIVVN